MHIMKSGRVLVATFVVAGLAASPALASGGPIDRRSPDAKDAAAAITAAKTIDRRSPDVQDMASRPDTAGNAQIGSKDLRTTSSLAGPPARSTCPPGRRSSRPTRSRWPRRWSPCRPRPRVTASTSATPSSAPVAQLCCSSGSPEGSP